MDDYDIPDARLKAGLRTPHARQTVPETALDA